MNASTSCFPTRPPRPVPGTCSRLIPCSEAILKSVRKTSKVVIIDEANQTCAAGAQVASLIAERAWEDLDGPVVRVATPDVPIPFSPPLEQAVLPQVDDVREACRELLEY